MKYVRYFSILWVIFFYFPAEINSDITGTRHDLRSGNVALNPNNPKVRDIKATDEANETQICKFCHIPHSAYVVNYTTYDYYSDIYTTDPSFRFRLPLISHVLTSTGNYAWVATYDYSSFVSTWTYPAEEFQEDPVNYPTDPFIIAWTPSGAAKVCFSCHDGTVKLGALADGTTIAVGGTGTTDGYLDTADTTYRPNTPREHFANLHNPALWPTHRFYSSYVSQYLIDQHNSEVAALYLHPIGSLEPRLDRNGYMQCTACHDPHKSGFAGGVYTRQFWRYPNEGTSCTTTGVSGRSWGCHFN